MPSLIANSHENVTGRLEDAVAASLGSRGKALEHSALFDIDTRDLQCIDIRAVIVFCVGDSRLKNLLYDSGALLGRKSQAPKNYFTSTS